MTPVRRWLIRGCFPTLFLLWAAGWAVSTCYFVGGDYIRGGYRLGGRVVPGAVSFVWERNGSVADGWYGGLFPQPFHLVDPNFWWDRDSFVGPRSIRSTFCLVGFSYEHVSQSCAPDPPIVRHAVGVPFWFLLLVSGIALRWAWRKTAPSITERTGFPVEAVSSNKG